MRFSAADAEALDDKRFVVTREHEDFSLYLGELAAGTSLDLNQDNHGDFVTAMWYNDDDTFGCELDGVGIVTGFTSLKAALLKAFPDLATSPASLAAHPHEKSTPALPQRVPQVTRNANLLPAADQAACNRAKLQQCLADSEPRRPRTFDEQLAASIAARAAAEPGQRPPGAAGMKLDTATQAEGDGKAWTNMSSGRLQLRGSLGDVADKPPRQKISAQPAAAVPGAAQGPVPIKLSKMASAGMARATTAAVEAPVASPGDGMRLRSFAAGGKGHVDTTLPLPPAPPSPSSRHILALGGSDGGSSASMMQAVANSGAIPGGGPLKSMASSQPAPWLLRGHLLQPQGNSSANAGGSSGFAGVAKQTSSAGAAASGSVERSSSGAAPTSAAPNSAQSDPVQHGSVPQDKDVVGIPPGLRPVRTAPARLRRRTPGRLQPPAALAGGSVTSWLSQAAAALVPDWLRGLFGATSSSGHKRGAELRRADSNEPASKRLAAAATAAAGDADRPAAVAAGVQDRGDGRSSGVPSPYTAGTVSGDPSGQQQQQQPGSFSGSGIVSPVDSPAAPMPGGGGSTLSCWAQLDALAGPIAAIAAEAGPWQGADPAAAAVQLLSGLPAGFGGEDVGLLLEASEVVKATHPYALVLAWHLFTYGSELHEELCLPEVEGVTEANAELLVFTVCCWVGTYVLDRQQALSESEVAARLALAVADGHGDGTRVTEDTVLELEYRLFAALDGSGCIRNFMPLLQHLVQVHQAAAAAAEGEVAAGAGEEAAAPPVSAASGKLPAVPVNNARGEAAAAEAGAAPDAAAGLD